MTNQRQPKTIRPENYHKGGEGPPALPVIEVITPSLMPYRVDYGPSRGWREFATMEQAQEDLLNFIDMRINSLSRELFEMCRLKRRMEKEQQGRQR